MLFIVNAVGVDAEERVGEPAMVEGSWVVEEERDEKADEGEYDAKAEATKAIVDFKSSDDPASDVLKFSQFSGRCRPGRSTFLS